MSESLTHRQHHGTLTWVMADALWRTSRHSGTEGNCVEVATNLPGIVGLRDSKDPGGAKLVLSRAEWVAFVRKVQAGTFR